MTFEKQLTEKLRPSKLSEIILLDRVKNSIGDGVIKTNQLYCGTPGSGKTSLMKLLVKGKDYKYINTSEERGIDTVREIIEYCSTYSTFGVDEPKYVLLDELDGATPDFFKAFRGASEKYPHIIFLATCNYLNKVPDPIQSRFLVLEFDPKNSTEEEELYSKYAKRINVFCKHPKILNEEVSFENDDVLMMFVKKNFPDMRRIVRKLQDFQTSKIGVVTMENIKLLNYTFNDLFDLAISKPQPEVTYKKIYTEYANKVDDVFLSFGAEFATWIEENHSKLIKYLAQTTIEVAKYQFMKTQMIDQPLALLAMIFEIQRIMNDL